MWINKDLTEKLERVVDYLDQSIGTEEGKQQSLQQKITNLEKAIDKLKIEKRDLEIDLKKSEAEDELKIKEMDAKFNREKIDINHLISLDKEKAEQTREHEKRMVDVQIKEKENELSKKYNEQVRTLIEKRDAENQKLLTAHMGDLKEMMTQIMQRLPTVNVGASIPNVKVK